MTAGMNSSFGDSTYGFMMLQFQNNQQIRQEETLLSMQAESEKAEWNKWKMIRDTQNKIYEIQQTVAVDQAKTQDKMFNKWDEYIKQ